uniref:hypothetical protein n=1 Tax=Nonomuraea pusilla TaxID=46177 RepID=UPI0006E1519D|nr:hypothetical protein [Nonomuraea pusilla]
MTMTSEQQGEQQGKQQGEQKGGRRFLAVAARRWPAALAVASAVLTADAAGSTRGVAALAEVLLLLPLLYLVMAKLRRPGLSWLVLAALVVPFVASRALDALAPVAVVAVVAPAVLIWGLLDGQLRRPGPLRVQAVAMAGFAAFAAAGLVLDPTVGRYVLAAGWLLHGVWDFVHLRRESVVSRSYAEWCGGLDVLVGVALLVAW